MKEYLKSVAKAYFLALLLVAVGMGLRRLFGHASVGPWWLWWAAVPAAIGVIVSIPVLFSKNSRSGM